MPVLATIVFSHVLPSLAFMIYLASRFEMGIGVVVLHTTIVGAVTIAGLVSLWLLGRLWRVREWRPMRWVLPILPALATTFLLMLQAANYVSQMSWGNSVSYEVTLSFLRALLHSNSAQVLTLSPSVYVAIVFCFVALYVIYVWCFRRVCAAVDDAFTLVLARRTVLRYAIAGVCVAIVSAVLPVWMTANAGTMRFEPIVGFFVSDLASKLNFKQQSLRNTVREQDLAERTAYASGGQRPFRKANVIVIVVDSLRADHTEVYGYDRPTTPFLKKLHASGKLKHVDMALSTCAESNCGILSTLGSKTFNRLVAGNFKLPELLRDQGYAVNFILSGEHDWFGLMEHYGDTPSFFYSYSEAPEYVPTDDKLLLQGLEKVPDFKNKPGFFFFHLMSSHVVGLRHREYEIFNPSDITQDDLLAIPEGACDPQKYVNYYDNGIRQADDIISELFAGLDRKGYLQNSIVVIVGDHGEGLKPERFGHRKYLHQDCLRIPMFIYDSAHTPVANLEFATQVDVAPTILDLLGLPIPKTWQGSSLLNPVIKSVSVHQTEDHQPAFAVMYRANGVLYKFMRYADGREGLFQLNADPGETNDLLAQADPALVQFLRGTLAEYMAE